MTPAQERQIDECEVFLLGGGTPQELRDLGYAEAAIQRAVRNAAKSNYGGRRMADRARLPHRRPNVSGQVRWNGIEIAVTVGYDPVTGEAREVFASGSRFGSDLQAVIDDACVVISLALQFGARPADLSRSLGTIPSLYDPEQSECASVIGAIVQHVIAEAQQTPIPGDAA